MISQFPFDLLQNNEIYRIFIYGAGLTGDTYQKQIDAQDNKTVINLGFIDNFVTTETASYETVKRVGVKRPELLSGAAFDYVVLACQNHLVPEIMESLFQLGVHHEKILLGRQYYQNDRNPNMGKGWDGFYDRSEKDADLQMNFYISKFITKYDFSLENVLDFPSGRGRMAEALNRAYGAKIGTLTCCDANKAAIDYCRERFAAYDNFGFSINEVDENNCLPLAFSDNQFSFIYSWDSMVHFSYRWLDFYIYELYRTVAKGGHVLIHHSNLRDAGVNIGRNKSELWSLNRHGRSNISAYDVAFMAKSHRFDILEQEVIDFNYSHTLVESLDENKKLDCITILQKPY